MDEQQIAESLPPEVIDMIRAYGNARAAQERARWWPIAVAIVQLWDDGGVFDTPTLRRIVEQLRPLVE